MKRISFLFLTCIVLIAFGISSGLLGFTWSDIEDRLKVVSPKIEVPRLPGEKVKIVSEESVVLEVVDKVGPSVVTVGIEADRTIIEFDPFDPFSIFESPSQRQEKEERDIGSGFIISSEGLIVTNKHVVSETNVNYRVITEDNKTYEIEKIYRDPTNDIAIVKISPPAVGLKPVELGNSSSLKVGQFVVAIGTALGEFRNTVTTGVISGLGRGITAGSPFAGFVERLDDVIQTDAAINPGNSGGPLVNSSAQVIGVNVAVASGAENIGFAIPINVVKEALDNFNKTGQFSRPFLGVRYRMISRDLAIMNEVPQGAYIVEVVAGSPADEAGLQVGDIITKADGKPLREDDGGLAKIINEKKIGDRLSLDVWRDGETLTLTTTLGEFEE